MSEAVLLDQPAPQSMEASQAAEAAAELEKVQEFNNRLIATVYTKTRTKPIVLAPGTVDIQPGVYVQGIPSDPKIGDFVTVPWHNIAEVQVKELPKLEIEPEATDETPGS